jgi:outer membrane protein OmpA-like peptidoglycan-associated protein
MTVPALRKLFVTPRTILLLGVVMVCIPVTAQTQPGRFWPERLRSGGAARAATCSVEPKEVLVGEPVTATVTAGKFNPKHTLTYVWHPSSGGGKIIGTDMIAHITTTDAAPGKYIVTVHVTDAKEKKNNEEICSANFIVKPWPPKNPPSMSVSANAASLQAGASANLSAKCTSPDGVPVSVGKWTASGGTVSGDGGSATLNTTGAMSGSITVGATCTDSRGLNAQASTEVVVENLPPPQWTPEVETREIETPEIKATEAHLALHSIYFPTDIPAVGNPDAGLVDSQRQTLVALAADFKKYLDFNPGAHLMLEGHADPRGRTEYDQALSERRAARVKSFLVEQGISEGNIETKALGTRHALSDAAVKDAVENNPELSPEDRQRALSNLQTIVLASDRRVDITLSTTGESSVRRLPLNAADALTLIGGWDGETKKKTGDSVPDKKANQRRP